MIFCKERAKNSIEGRFICKIQPFDTIYKFHRLARQNYKSLRMNEFYIKSMVDESF
ncbi:MAG: hypothetical protein ACJAZ3_001341 [Sphingobacteriales bacterium]|jgi:hypothetical protein